MKGLLNLADIIDDYLCQKNTNLSRFSQEIGINERIVNRWFHLKYYPSAENAIRLAVFFDCSVDYLFGLSAEPNKPPEIDAIDFYSRFLRLKQKTGNSNYAIAKYTKVSESTISKWNPKTVPSMPSVIALSLSMLRRLSLRRKKRMRIRILLSVSKKPPARVVFCSSALGLIGGAS